MVDVIFPISPNYVSGLLRSMSVIACFRQLRSWKLLKIDVPCPKGREFESFRARHSCRSLSGPLATISPLLMRHTGRVMVSDQSPAPLLLYPYSGKASVVGNCVAFILPIHC
jgi:hypothetical protein